MDLDINPLEIEIQDPFPEPQNLISQLVTVVRSAELPTLRLLAQEAIQPELFPPADFLNGLTNSQQIDVFRGCLLVHILSLGTKVPRKFQLEAVLGSLSGQDGVISSGSGSGKTMIMILLLLLRPKEMAILIVPLKRLQNSQVTCLSLLSTLPQANCLLQFDAFTSFGIRSVVVNEDTPNDPDLWKVSSPPYSKPVDLITTLENCGRLFPKRYHDDGVDGEA